MTRFVDFCYLRVTVGDGPIRTRSPPRSALSARPARQLDREGGAAARRRLHQDTAFHPLDELAADVQAEAAAADAVRLRRVEAVELLEDPLVLLGRDAGSLVADRDRDRPLVRPDAHLGAAVARGVLDRILDQVVEHLAQAAGVGVDGADVLGGDELDLRALADPGARGLDGDP